MSSIPDAFVAFHGEEVLHSDRTVTYITALDKAVNGTLVLTNFRLLFEVRHAPKQQQQQQQQHVTQCTLTWLQIKRKHIHQCSARMTLKTTFSCPSEPLKSLRRWEAQRAGDNLPMALKFSQRCAVMMVVVLLCGVFVWCDVSCCGGADVQILDPIQPRACRLL